MGTIVSPEEPDLFSSEMQYHQDVERLPILTCQQEQALVARAKQGDAQAREALLLSCQRYIRRVATKYAHVYAWASPRVEYLDLVGIANLAVVECLDKALAHENPLGFLRNSATWAIVHYCPIHTSLITSARDHQFHALPAYEMESLDVPLNGESGLTWADVFEAPSFQVVASDQAEPDYHCLYEAIDELPELHRSVIQRSYGLKGEPESLNSIGLSLRARLGSRERGKQSRIAVRYQQQAVAQLRQKVIAS